MNRRVFNKIILGSIGSIILNPRPGLAFGQSAGNGSKNIIIVNLFGGADTLNLFPFAEGTVEQTIRTVCRPNIFINPSSTLLGHAQNGMGNKIGFHPSLSRLVTEASGKMALLKRSGITGNDPGRSHEDCQNAFSVAGTRLSSAASAKGWLARLMDIQNLSSFQVYGIGISDRVDFRSDEQRPILMSDLSSFGYNNRDFSSVSCNECGGDKSSSSQDDSTYARQIATQLSGIHNSETPLEDNLVRVQSAVDGATQLMASANSETLSGNYNAQGQGTSTFGRNCQAAAKLLKYTNLRSPDINTKTKFVYLNRGGWDTHANEISTMASNAADLGAGLAGLIQDMKAAGLWENTTIMIYSEFGRTNYQNNSSQGVAGTDHAYASTHLVLGGSVVDGVYGDDPTVADLTDKNHLVPTIDYRDALKDIIRWGGYDQSTISQIFPETYPNSRSLGILG
jgi:uncharacterized protein (DUF1501 family)